jgi:hypothetical protein
MAASSVSGVALAVGAEFAVVAFLVILAGDFPAPVAAFVALLWMLFLINRAGASSSSGGSIFSAGKSSPILSA